MPKEMNTFIQAGSVIISFAIVGAMIMTAYRYKKEGLVEHIGNLAAGIIGLVGAVIITPIICLVFVKNTAFCDNIAALLRSMALPSGAQVTLGEDVVSPVLLSITRKTVYQFVRGIVFFISMLICTAVGKVIASVGHIAGRVTARFSLTDMLNRWGGFFYGLLVQYVCYCAIFFGLELLAWFEPVSFIVTWLHKIPACSFFFKCNVFHIIEVF